MELFLEGVFLELNPEMLFGVFSAMVVELPRKAKVFDARKYRGFSKRVEQIMRSDIVQDSAAITGQPVVWEGSMIPIGKAWAEGKTLAEILLMISTDTDVSGTLIGAFRRAKDLATQLRNAWRDFPDKVEMLNKLIRSISRDEVEVVD